jgi:NADPH-dependent 2,4-dienoyl-CoA reductase/sulfur reductase-like enzyme/peroxiredoxin family protein/rhodanese-related sulfurtransferase/TusA-related sulfurtransferase
MVKKVIIVGGVAGGASCAVRLRRLDETAKIIMLERGDYISFANCGLPYYIGDVIKEKEKLIVESPQHMHERFNIDIRNKSEVISIDRENKSVKIKDLRNNNIYSESFDNLVLSPGAIPVRPPIPGINLSNIFTLRNIPDTEVIRNYINLHKPVRAVIVGGGYIGLEMAENLANRGIEVTICELLDQVMSPLDYEMAAFVHQHLKSKNVELYLSDGVKKFEKETDISTIVELQSGEKLRANLVIFGVGIKPEIELAKESGLEIGKLGGIKVNDHLQTSDPDIFSIGDAIEITDYINKKPAIIALAGPANKQGRIAANNICGRTKGIDSVYRGTQGTSIAKIFDLTIATTGNNEKLLKRYNIPYLNSYTQNSSHAGYYPNAIPLSIKLIFSPDDGKILGAQIIGYEGVDKRIDVIATAIRAGMTVYDLEELELAYAPPYSSAKDPVNIAGFVASNILKGDTDVVYWDKIGSIKSNKSVVLDVRTDEEVKLGAINDFMHIPLRDLRSRMNELPKDKEIIVYCQTGQRAYYAERILKQNGFNVKNLSGGYKAYKMTTEIQTNEGIFDDLEIPTNDVISAKITPVAMEAKKIPTSSIEIDACGLACPGPIMKVGDTMKNLKSGDILKITATDPGFFSDIQTWAEKTNNKLIDISEEKGVITALIKKEIPKIPSISAPVSIPNGKNMIIFSDDFDKVTAAFIIANGAASMGRQVHMFFTFWGLNILRKTKKSKKLKIKKNFQEKLFGKMMPRGVDHLTISQMNMYGLGTRMIKDIMKKKNVEPLQNLMQSAINYGVKLIACQMTMGIMGIKKEELIDGVTIGGVATMLGASDESNMSLFI